MRRDAALDKAVAAALLRDRDRVGPPPPAPARLSKYRNKPEVRDGIRFASRAEARRYSQLRLLQAAGVISGLRLQPAYPLIVNGTACGAYLADFAYEYGGVTVVEDVKSPATRTPLYRLKAKLVLALYGVRVRETLG